jgi:hypothetical protein
VAGTYTVEGIRHILFGADHLLFVLGLLLLVLLQAHWALIAVRVGGSWIAASGLLMLGWSMRGS